MKQIAPNYAELLTCKLGEQVNPAGISCFLTKEFFRHTITLTFAFVLFLTVASAQKGTINGTVKGLEGVLPAATVAAGKTSVLTDNRGRFSISVNPGKS